MIRILTDSASDLTATDSARPGVYTVPLSVTFADGTGGLDGVELTADEFYAHLKVDKVPPRTSQPSPQSFMTIFEDAKENGDQVIAILISSNLSGTYQCARPGCKPRRPAAYRLGLPLHRHYPHGGCTYPAFAPQTGAETGDPDHLPCGVYPFLNIIGNTNQYFFRLCPSKSGLSPFPCGIMRVFGCI